MLTIHYDPLHGHVVPDNLAISHASGVVVAYQQGKLTDYTVGSDVLIQAFRLLVTKNEIEHTNIVFAFDDEVLTVDKGGRLDRWPNGFCDQIMNILAQLGRCSD